MSWTNLLKLLAGSVVVLVLLAGLTLLFNQRQHQATSIDASIAADEYPVGSDYAGTVTETYVKKGATVAVGAPLLSVQSAQLLHDIEQKAITPNTKAYTISNTGTITFRAPVGGAIAAMNTRTGAFVTASSTLVTIDRAASLFVTARYTLTPRDYERVTQNATVDLRLPDERTLSGRVTDISVTTEDGQTKAQVDVSSSALVQGDDNGLIRPGTPVTAILHLRDDGPLAGVNDRVQAFLQHIGLV